MNVTSESVWRDLISKSKPGPKVPVVEELWDELSHHSPWPPLSGQKAGYRWGSDTHLSRQVRHTEPDLRLTAAGLVVKLAASVRLPRLCDWWDGWLVESPLRTALSNTPALRVINLTVAQAELTIKRTERLMVERCPRWEWKKERMREDDVVLKGYEKIIKGVRSTSNEQQIKKRLFVYWCVWFFSFFLVQPFTLF